MLIYCICTQYLVGLLLFNYCLNSAWHGGDQFVALLRWYGSPGFFDSGLQLICIFCLCFSFSSWQYPYSLWVQVWWVCWPVKHQHHGHLTNFGAFGSVGRCQILLENEISFLKSWSAEGSMKCSKILETGCSDVGFQKTQWTKPADDIDGLPYHLSSATNWSPPCHAELRQ